MADLPLSNPVVRPHLIWLEGAWHGGLELCLDSGEVRASSLPADPIILSPPFFNAHSHLEYRGLMGRLSETSFVPWLREITGLKAAQSASDVAADCRLAAGENRSGGVQAIWEHSDRLGSADAMASNALSGRIFQEVITLGSLDRKEERMAEVLAKAEQQGAIPSPHAPYTVDEETLCELSKGQGPLSIHAAESTEEWELFAEGKGSFVDVLNRFGAPLPAPGRSPIEYLSSVGFLQPGRQLVHCCAVSDHDLELMAQSRIWVAHCPRSNRALGCPVAPVRRMRERGIPVGIGLDSAASSGPVSMLAEMAAALDASRSIGEPLTPEEVWGMAAQDAWEAAGLQSTGWIALPWLGSLEASIRHGEVRWL